MPRIWVFPPKGTKYKKPPCPACKKKGKWSRVWDPVAGELYPEEYGRCDREMSCGYNHYPTRSLTDRGGSKPKEDPTAWRKLPAPAPVVAKAPAPEPVKTTNPAVYQDPIEKAFQRTLDPSGNILYKFLCDTFGEDRVAPIWQIYRVGTTRGPRVGKEGKRDQRWIGSTVFWQIDCEDVIHDGKIMQYKPDGHRRKDKYLDKEGNEQKYNFIDWVGAQLKRIGRLDENVEAKKCLFGEHLLEEYPDIPVAIVESEKTALICAIYFDLEDMPFLWLATGGLSQDQVEKFECLKDRQIFLFPDLAEACRTCKKKSPIERALDLQAKALEAGIDMIVSKWMQLQAEAHYPELVESGGDLADYILDYDMKRPDPAPIEPVEEAPEISEATKENYALAVSQAGQTTRYYREDQINYEDPQDPAYIPF